MGINGVTVYEAPLPLEAQATYRHRIAMGQLSVFGAERLSRDQDNMPSAEAVNELTWAIEELSTAPDGRGGYGISGRTIETQAGEAYVRWNPAGIVGGFDVNMAWDGAPASIEGLKEERVWWSRPGAMLPRLCVAREGLFIDNAQIPWIRRTIRSALRHTRFQTAVKQANAEEIKDATALVASALDKDRLTSASHPSLRVFAEIGYGLDPMALRGTRRFTTKHCVELDKAIGSYQNRFGGYAEAVRTESARYARCVSKEMGGQYISFIIGDGNHLPFTSSSIHELFMSNVLNAPIEEGSRQELLNEAWRVLEPSGSLVMRINWHRDEWDHDKMVRLLRDSNFQVIRSVNHTDPQYLSLEAQYGTPNEVAAPEGYYIIAVT